MICTISKLTTHVSTNVRNVRSERTSSSSGVFNRSGCLEILPDRVRTAPGCSSARIGECDVTSILGGIGATESLDDGFVDVCVVSASRLFRCRLLRLTLPVGVAMTCEQGAFSAVCTTTSLA